MPVDRPRLNIDLPLELYDDLNECFQWGQKNTFFVSLFQRLVPLLQQYGPALLILVIKGEVKIETLITLLGKEEVDEKHKMPVV